MSNKNYRLFINGEWSDTDSTFSDYNPASGEVWAEIPDGKKDDAKKAIEAATGAQAEWAAMPHPQRAGSLLKKACVELGGKDALIILDDADMERALNAATFGTFMHQGQICMSVERIIIDQSIADEFTERFVEKVKTLGVGDPREMGNVIGPLSTSASWIKFTLRLRMQSKRVLSF